jgi:hypothetical protein
MVETPAEMSKERLAVHFSVSVARQSIPQAGLRVQHRGRAAPVFAHAVEPPQDVAGQPGMCGVKVQIEMRVKMSRGPGPRPADELFAALPQRRRPFWFSSAVLVPVPGQLTHVPAAAAVAALCPQPLRQQLHRTQVRPPLIGPPPIFPPLHQGDDIPAYGET